MSRISTLEEINSLEDGENGKHSFFLGNEGLVSKATTNTLIVSIKTAFSNQTFCRENDKSPEKVLNSAI